MEGKVTYLSSKRLKLDNLFAMWGRKSSVSNCIVNAPAASSSLKVVSPILHYLYIRKKHISPWKILERNTSVLMVLSITQSFSIKKCIIKVVTQSFKSFASPPLMAQFRRWLFTWTFSNHQKIPKMPSFFKKLTISLKLSFQLFF